MGPPTRSQDAPIMRVNSQSHVVHPKTPQHLSVNLVPRKFLIQSFTSPAPKQHFIDSGSLQYDHHAVQTPPIEFIDTQFKGGRPIEAERTRGEKPPPQKRRRKAAPEPRENRKTYLSARKPVENAQEVHKDIWKHILSFCTPKFLLDARFIDTIRHEILSHHQAIWRDSRLRHFGDDCPPCPSRLTEQQYVNLLVGKGCQVGTCLQRHTATVSWAFLGRLCTNCLRHRVTQAGDLALERQHQISATKPLWDALPMIHYDSSRHGAARNVNDEGTDWATNRGRYLFLKTDYDKLEAEYLEKKKADLSEAEITQWWQAKKDEAIRFMDEVGKISQWLMMSRWEQTGWNAERRRQFFQEKAADLNPPMKIEELECMTAYHKALRSANAPSEQSWEILKDKILPHRETAAKIIETRSAMRDFRSWSNPDPAAAAFRKLYEHRRSRRNPLSLTPKEQTFVLQLAREEYTKCIDGGVADCSLVLTCLKNVFGEYQRIEDKPNGMNTDGSRGPYVLSMDDARMIVEEVIAPEIKDAPERMSRVLESFKCPGCRTNHQRQMKFTECLKHIYQKHCQTVGEGGEFWRLLRRFEETWNDFPYYSTPWTRCLPVLPSYCDAREMRPWQPDSEMDFLHEEVRTSVSVYEGRAASWQGGGSPTFLDSFNRVLELMQRTSLKSLYIVKVAFRYGLDISDRYETTVPSMEEFINSLPPLQQKNSLLRFKFRCGACVRRSETNRARPVKYEVAVDALHKHWKLKHAPECLDWKEEFMHFPSDEELLDEMLKSDAKLRNEKKEITNFDQANDFKKRPNPKANVILAKKFAMDVFDELYPKAER